MYEFSGKIKMVSIALIIFGAIGIGVGFLSAPSSVDDVKEMMSQEASHDGDHETTNHEVVAGGHNEGTSDVSSEHHGDEHADTGAVAHDEHNDDAHAEHIYHQLKNRPWSAVYVSLFFFLGISLLVLAFYASQRVAQSAWSVVLFRVMEAITANLVPTSIIMVLVILSASVFHWNHMFVWMTEGTFDPTSENYDALVAGKAWWINSTGWTIRGIIYLAIWNAYRWYIRKNSIAEDTANDNHKTYKNNYNV